MEKITIYTSETCPYCKIIKEKLSSENIEFEEKLNTDHLDEWSRVSDLTGMPQLPTIVLGNRYLVPGRDFYGEDSLIEIINNAKDYEFEYEKMSFERVKTLNFNIFSAFQRLEQLLRQIENNTKKEEENEHKSNG